MEVFKDCQIVLDLTTSVSFKKKQEIRSQVTGHGGIISYIVTKKSTHVVCNDTEKADISYKCKMAAKYGLPVVSLDFIHDCVDQGRLLNTDNYLMVGKTKSQEFSSGKIAATKYERKNVQKKRIRIDPKSVKVWRSSDKNCPVFNEKQYEVAKYAIFKRFDKVQETCLFYNLEIHVSDPVDSNRSDIPCYRVYSHYGSTQDLETAVVEHRYLTTSDDALCVYSHLYQELTRPPNNMEVVYQPVMRNIGSEKFQKMVEEYGMDACPLSYPVVDLMEHIWKEATGEIEHIISSPLQKIKLEQIEKTEAILLKLRNCSDNDESVELVKEFYRHLPHRPQYMTTPTGKEMRSWLSKKQDICQMIKDMVAVSEATNWSTRSSTEAKYRALRCRVESLETTCTEYKQIKEHILQSLKQDNRLVIENIFCIQRQVEEDNFQKNLHPKKLLFHASKVQNFVGILSRGLMLPKVVTDDFGGTRTDAGMLGNGIYFASSASTSIKYSDQSKCKGTRMMLVSNVALGNCQDFTEYQQDLQGPPEGFDSCHGVASTDDNKSEFLDDEYVIYNTNQQVTRYLVEFSIKGDIKTPLQVNRVSDDVIEENEMVEDKVDLKDVTGIKDPLSKVEPGLVSTAGESCILRSVHIKAQLIDLASKVIVLQEYFNNSSCTLEAKYVFPLDDMAAVCGFEAFINGKHIVGEVKEKETAHKEYKKAISEGHGAYLMDQDEETPDVFTVSVGNLPPGCVALIKITYVSELQVDGELINFSIPGSVAPWKQEANNTEMEANQCSIQVSIKMPFDIRSIKCPTHNIRKKTTSTSCMVEMLAGQEISDGFQLLIGLAEIHVPRMWVEVDEEGEQTEAAMLTFYPEFEAAEDNEIEVILVLDLSNSMKGKALIEAKKVLMLTLTHLTPHSLFNIVVFGTNYKELFPTSQPKTKSAIKTAEVFIKGIQANMGNTEVYRPLHSLYLLKLENSLRNIFLISDGHVNNEEITLKAVHNNCQHTRIFTFGISSIANKHVLKALSRLGAGSFEFFDSQSKSKWEGKVKSQIQKASQPVLTSLSVAWQQFDEPPPIQAPKQITALFNGSRLVVYGFVNNCRMAVLKAVVGGQEISTSVFTPDLNITQGKNLHRLTAKALIRDWEDGVLSSDSIEHQLKKMDMKEYIVQLSKEYSIVTSLTSFIAVEKREKDEMISSDGPTIAELVDKENVDFLPYLNWDDQKDKESVKDGKFPPVLTALDDLILPELMEDFAMFDPDSTGSIPTESLRPLMTYLGFYPTNAELEDFIKNADINRSGILDLASVTTLMSSKMKEEMREAFRKFDKDGHGYVTSSDLKHILTNLGEEPADEEINEMIRKADVEGTGKINYDDMIVLMGVIIKQDKTMETVCREKEAKSYNKQSTIQELQKNEEMLKKREKYLEEKMDQAMAMARENARKNKRVALSALKRKRQYEQQLQKVDTGLTTIEFQLEALENATTNADVMRCMSGATTALKQGQPQSYSSLTENLYANEISEALSSDLSKVDDEDLTEELEEELEELMEDNDISQEEGETAIKEKEEVLDMSSICMYENTRHVAIDISDEIESQDMQLNRIMTKSGYSDERIQETNQRAVRLLECDVSVSSPPPAILNRKSMYSDIDIPETYDQVEDIDFVQMSSSDVTTYADLGIAETFDQEEEEEESEEEMYFGLFDDLSPEEVQNVRTEKVPVVQRSSSDVTMYAEIDTTKRADQEAEDSDVYMNYRGFDGGKFDSMRKQKVTIESSSSDEDMGFGLFDDADTQETTMKKTEEHSPAITRTGKVIAGLKQSYRAPTIQMCSAIPEKYRTSRTRMNDVPAGVKQSYMAPTIHIDSASPEKHQTLSLSDRTEKKSACMGSPDLSSISGSPRKSKQLPMQSPKPSSGKPSVRESSTSQQSTPFQPLKETLSSSLYSGAQPQSSSIESSYLSVPTQQQSKITPTIQHASSSQPPPAPKARAPPRRMSGQYDASPPMKDSPINKRFRNVRPKYPEDNELRRLSVDLTREMLASSEQSESLWQESKSENISSLLDQIELDSVEDAAFVTQAHKDLCPARAYSSTFTKAKRRMSEKIKTVHDFIVDKASVFLGNDSGYINDDLQRYQTALPEAGELVHNLSAYGIGSNIASVKTRQGEVNKSNLEKLFELQEEDGSWSLTPGLCELLGIEFDVCVDILKEAGIKSLALKVQEEIVTLLATCITLLYIIQLLSPNWLPAHMHDKWEDQLRDWLAETSEGGKEQIDDEHFHQHSRMIKTVNFYHEKEEEYKWTSHMLELGHCWGEVAAKMMGVA